MPTIPLNGYGTKTTTGGNDTLFSTTTAGTYALTIDLKNMQAGDTLVVRAYSKGKAGAALYILFSATFSGVQADPDKLQKTMVVVAPFQAEFRIQRTAGTDRSYDWRVDQIGSCSVLFTGTLATTVSEQTLGGDVTSNQTIVLLTDHGSQLAGQQVTLRAREAAITGGTVQEVWNFTPAVGVLAEPNVLLQSIPLNASYKGRFTIQRIAGGDYSVLYTVVAISS